MSLANMCTCTSCMQVSSMTPATSHRPARSSPSAQRSHMLGAVIAWALACAAVRAEADAGCSAVAATILEDYAETNPGLFTTAGCDEADDYTICEFRGSAGPCSANPACPENQIDTFGCAAEADATCCLEEFRKPACDGCEPVLTACISACDGPAPPPATPEEALAGACADIADLALPRLAADFPAQFTAGCDGAAVGLVCDLNGYGGACTDAPQCADIAIAGDCSPAAAETGCCVVFEAPPCDGCTAEPVQCFQTCATEPAAPAMMAAPPTCAARFDGVLESLAMMDPTTYANGCDNSDPFLFCDLQGLEGSCEANPVCPSDQINPGRCTADTGPPECCEVLFTKACDACEPIPLRCLNLCTSDTPAPPATAREQLDRRCTDNADLLVSIIRAEDPEVLAETCAVAAPGQLCDINGGAGPCSSTPECVGVDITRDESCTAENEDLGCCSVFVGVLCPGCAPEPLFCFLSC